MAAKDEPIEGVIRRAAGGRQDYIRGDGTTSGDFQSGARLDSAAVQTASLTTSYRIPIVGNDSVTVLLKPTTLTGTVTVTLAPTLADGVTADSTTASSGTLTVSTLSKFTLAGFGGASFALLTIVTSAASTSQFLLGSGGIAEYRAL